jgi:tRNA threonylcarbamoyladenosine biosynthesis protein TsaE
MKPAFYDNNFQAIELQHKITKRVWGSLFKREIYWQHRCYSVIHLLMELDFSSGTIQETAGSFWQIAGETPVIAFHGEMGSGKTTFIHALCKVKGVEDAVSSPTFSIINQYNYVEGGKEKRLFHIDLYRLKNEEEALRAGVEDCLYSGDTCLLEWPERAQGILPPNTLHVNIIVTGSATRKLIISRK